jgi:hypothetical protein
MRALLRVEPGQRRIGLEQVRGSAIQPREIGSENGHAPAEAPTPTAAMSSGLSPFFTSRFCTAMWVLEPGAVTPIFQPLRSFGDLYWADAAGIAARLAISAATTPINFISPFLYV